MVEKRRVGGGQIEIAPLALGGNVFGWTADEATSFAILDAFVDAGGTMIDTADVYSAWVPGNQGGESETVIGNWLKRDLSKREKVIIATKVGFMAGLAPETIAPSCEASLQRLGVDAIDLYYQHKDDESVPLSDSLGAFDDLVKAGKIREIGLSQFSAPRLAEAMETVAANGLHKPCCLQTWYNMVEREKLEGELREVAIANGLGIFPFYSLANGFLTGKYRSKEDLDQSPRGLRNVAYLEGRGPQVLDAMDAIAVETGEPLATIAIAWTMAQPGITAALASATSLDQLRQITAALDMKLSADQVERLNAASAAEEPAEV